MVRLIVEADNANEANRLADWARDRLTNPARGW
jgi:hypothetical protein